MERGAWGVPSLTPRLYPRPTRPRPSSAPSFMRDRPMRTPPMLRPCIRPQRPSVIAFLPRKYAVFPLSLASIQQHFSTEASRRTSPTAHAFVRVRAWHFVGCSRVRLRVTWSGYRACFFSFSEISHVTPLRQPFSLSAKRFHSCHAPHHAVLGPGSQSTLRKASTLV
jgi:hypothetical protein